MRPPAKIEKHQTPAAMFAWLRAAPDQQAHCRRTAIWLTRTGQLHAHKVAEMLGVSKQAVWLWISQYNTHGPPGLDRPGKGGSRHFLVDKGRERHLMTQLVQQCDLRSPPTGREVRQFLTQSLGRTVSLSYAYRFLRDNGWWQLLEQRRSDIHVSGIAGQFTKYARPWEHRR